MTTNWKYTDASHQNVVRTLDSGAQESCAAGRADVLAWVDEGNTISPYVASIAELNAAILAQLDAVDIDSIRPLRAIAAAIQASITPNSSDVTKLDDLNAQAATLRAQLR